MLLVSKILLNAFCGCIMPVLLHHFFLQIIPQMKKMDGCSSGAGVLGKHL